MKKDTWKDNNINAYIRNRRMQQKQKAVAYLGSKCVDCGLETCHIAVYEFHHVDPSTKERDISSLLNRSWDNMQLELDKCVLLCANCHAIREWDTAC